MKFRHLPILVCSLCILGYLSQANAQNWRTPQNYMPDTDVFANYEEESFERKMWLNDHSGALLKLRDDVSSWVDREEYLNDYGLEDLSTDRPLTIEQKRRRIEKGMLRYLDKRLMHKVKTAPKGSKLASVKSARKALRPSSTAAISKNFKLKFRAKLLRGRGNILFINPWVDANAQFSLSGKFEFNLERQFQAPQISTQVRVNFHESEWIALMQKTITSNLKAQVLSVQPTKTMAFESDADRRIQLLFNKNF